MLKIYSWRIGLPHANNIKNINLRTKFCNSLIRIFLLLPLSVWASSLDEVIKFDYNMFFLHINAAFVINCYYQKKYLNINVKMFNFQRLSLNNICSRCTSIQYHYLR